MGTFMWATVISVSVSVAGAQAQEADQGPPRATAFAFEDDLVHGDTLGPNVEVLTSRRRGTRGSLIRAREHFVDQLLASIEDL